MRVLLAEPRPRRVVVGPHVVLLVTDDAPFLVDTVRIVLERHGVATHLLVHPMLHVRRDPDGS